MESLAKKISQSLFFSKNTRKISFLEIARTLRVNERTAKRYIKKDLESGFITKEATKYQCLKQNFFLTKRNTHTLTDKKQPSLNGYKRGRLTLQRLTNQGRSSL